MSFIRAAACGLLAGAAGTLVMDLVWYRRYRRGGGESRFLEWEFASAPSSWDKASVPANVGRLLFETITHTELSEQAIGVTTNLMHWGYGSQWGVVLAFGLGSAKCLRPWHGPLLGALVWLASYVSLPIAGFYKPIWSYDPGTLWQDLSAHLVYGAGAIAAFWAACRS